MACGPVKCSPFSSRISNWPRHRCASSVRETSSDSCRCPSQSSTSCRIICGTAAHSLAFSVRLPQRPPSWTTHDRGRTPLPVPPSSRHQPGSSGQSSSIPAYLRRRYGARRHLLARAPTSHGTFSDPHHHALCPTRSQGCLGRIRPGHRKPDPFGIFSHPMSQSRPSLEEIFETHIQTLALTRRPATVSGYRGAARRFLSFLRTDFPCVSRLSQLRRDPHLLAWLASLWQKQLPLSNKTRANNLLCLRRLLDDLTANGHSLRPELILRQDFPPQPQCTCPDLFLHQTIYCS